MKIRINKQDYNIKYTVRAIMLFEQVKGAMFSINTLTDEYLFLYCMILANNKETDLKFDELLDYIDNDSSIMTQLAEFMKLEAERQNQLNSKKEDSEGESGKN